MNNGKEISQQKEVSFQVPPTTQNAEIMEEIKEDIEEEDYRSETTTWEFDESEDQDGNKVFKCCSDERGSSDSDISGSEYHSSDGSDCEQHVWCSKLYKSHNRNRSISSDRE